MCNSTTLTKSGQVTLASDDGKADEEENSSIPDAKIVDCITACICVGHGSHIVEQQKNIVNVILILMSPGFAWTVKMSVFLLIKELCSRLYNIGNDSQETSLHTGVSSFVHELFHSASSKVVECIHAIKIAQVHIAASECLLEMTELYGDLPPVQWMEVGFKSELLHQYEAEKNEQAKSLLKKSFDILENLERQKIQTS